MVVTGTAVHSDKDLYQIAAAMEFGNYKHDIVMHKIMTG